jgi:hypothetical protein
MGTLFGEIRVFASRIGTLRSVLLHLVLLLAFGVWIPRSKGPDFLDAQVLGAYACLGLIFAGPAAAQSFTDGPVPFKVAWARVLVGIFYGETAVAALTGSGIATVYLSARGGYIPPPDWVTLARAAIFGLAAAGMIATMAAWLATRFSRRMAMIALRVVFFATLVLFFYKGRWLPDVALAGAAVCLVAGLVFFDLLRRACRGL